MALETKKVFAQKLVQEAHVPLVLLAEGSGKVLAFNTKGQYVLPDHAKEVLGENHPFLSVVTQDLIDLCYHPESGDMVLSGWTPEANPITFPLEKGAHAGPGSEEVNGFAMLPSDVLNFISGPCEHLRKIAQDNLMEIWISQLRPATQLATDDEHPDIPHLTATDLRELSTCFLNKNFSAPMDFSVVSKESETLSQSKTLRVMTYNVHSCIGMDGKDSPQRIARVIGRHEPDIVGLQELDMRRLRTKGADQPQVIARELEMLFHFHPSIAMEEEQYGDALLTRLPMQLIKAGPLPGLSQKPNLEPRGVIWCAVKVGGVDVQIFNTHLGLLKKERLNQVEALLSKDWIGRALELGPVVLLGDFNMLPGSLEYKRLGEVLKDAQREIPNHEPQATWLSHYPVTRIDHVFISTDLKVKTAYVSKTQLERLSSDHLPLVVDIKIES
jgi:endonuclease/exonuclease/phosphatase family metal-dependent hydrolase